MSNFIRLDPARITSEICMACGGCCKFTIRQPISHSDDGAYYEAIFRHNDLIATDIKQNTANIICRCSCLNHETDSSGKQHYSCSIYSTRPTVCKNFNCFDDANKHQRLPEFYDRIVAIEKEISGQ